MPSTKEYPRCFSTAEENRKITKPTGNSIQFIAGAAARKGISFTNHSSPFLLPYMLRIFSAG
jgi:hypothetical protein